MTIKQNTKEWLEKKQKYIGASEIFALVLYYCKEELKLANIDVESETSFKSCLEIFINKKFDVSFDALAPDRGDFGLALEDGICHLIKNQYPDLSIENKKDFVTNSNIHKLAACSPDLHCSIKNGQFTDFDKKNVINQSMGNGLIEVKTCDFGFNFQSKYGAKWQYIFQLQYQLLVCGLNWGFLYCIAPNDSKLDKPYFRGKTAGLCASSDYSIIENEYLNYSYFFVANKAIQKICLLALQRFEKALGQNILPNKSEGNAAKLHNEKQMLSKIWPNRFGEKELTSSKDDSLIDHYLNEVQACNNQTKIIETQKQEYICDIIKYAKDNLALIGSSYQAKFDKRGSLRFSQRKI